MEELKDISELEGLVYPGAQSFTQADQPNLQSWDHKYLAC